MNQLGKNIYFSDLINGKNNNFDFIRFIAATLVIFSHAFPLTGNVDLLSSFSNGQTNIGHLSVVIFFVISGYFITQSFVYSNSLIKYMKARVLRIFPALFIALLFTVFVIGALVTSIPFNEYIRNIETYNYLKAIFLYPMYWNLPGVFENNPFPNSVNGSLWSIPFEFMFYIFVAILGVLFLIRKKVVTTIFVLLCALVFFDYWPFSNTHFWGLEIKQILELLLYFCSGMMVFLYKEKIVYSNFLAMLSIVILYLSIYFNGFNEFFVFFGTYLIFYFGYNQKIKTWEFYKYGDFSYGIYIYAFPIQQATVYYFNGNMSPYLNFIISFIIALLLSIISWYLVENNALKLKNKYVFILTRNIIDLEKKYYIQSNKKMNSLINSLKGKAWPIFSVFLVIFITYFSGIFNVYPKEITFPNSINEKFFEGNWLSQSADENYRWIEKSGYVMLKNKEGKQYLIINGYKPVEYNNVTSLIVTINGNEVGTYDITNGEIDIKLPIEQNNEIIKVGLNFNDVYIPDNESPDQRQLSGLISLIGFE